MNEADRALVPLDEAQAAITQLDTYEKPQELAGALEAIGRAVERSLRQLLRLDASQPEDIRLHAHDATRLPFERVVTMLREQQRISFPLANEVHELRQIAQRAGTGVVRATDADHALGVVQRLRAEVVARPAAREQVENEAAVRSAAHGAVARGEFGDEAHSVPRVARRAPLRIALALLLLALGFLGYRAATGWFGSPSELEQGVEAFREGRLGVAEQHFRAALREEEGATAELYLGRVLRRQGRLDEAGAVLNAARKRYPRDADLLRELGHLLAVDLGRPAAAVPAFRRAVEMDSTEDANWIGLVRALRASGDASADHWLGRAPPSAQAVLRSGPVE